MKKTVITGILVSLPAFAVELSYSVKSFTWKEYDSAGKQLLKESGFLHQIGIKHSFSTESLYITPSLGVEVGSVNYDGQTQTGTPVSTDTNYWGVLTRIAVGTNIKLFFVESGLGYDYWKRNIESKSSAIGYAETWSQFYIPLQIGIKKKLNETAFKIFGEYRFNIETKNVPSLYSVTTKPKSGLFFTVGAGAEVGRITFNLSYSYDKWKKSDPVIYIDTAQNLAYRVWQPESKREIIEASIGYKF
ncbi:hypothetical protein [Persephonella sp.]